MLHEWAIQWGVPLAALHDLERRTGTLDNYLPDAPVLGDRSEAAVSNLVRAEATRKGMRLWRNNVGKLDDEYGRPVRYGLANDSPEVNKVLKSADLIGIDPTPITLADVGKPRGQFVSAECKPEGWHYTATPREKAQQSWALRVITLGGRALFVNREGML